MKIAIVGCFQNGKSTLINCLLGTKLAQTGGDGVSVTSANVSFRYHPENTILDIDNKKLYEINNMKRFYKRLFTSTHGLELLNQKIKNAKDVILGCNANILNSITLIDTPGFNAKTEETQTAKAAFDKMDAAMVVINNKGLSTVELDIFHTLQNRNIPYFIVMNCLWQGGTSIATWNPEHSFNKEKITAISAKIENEGLSPMLMNHKRIIPINAIWYWYAISQFQYEDEDKRESLQSMIDQYRGKYPDTDFEEGSHVEDIVESFSDLLQLIPIRVYYTLLHNLSIGIGEILQCFDDYSQFIQELTKQETDTILYEIHSLNEELTSKHKKLCAYEMEKKEYDSQSIFAQPRAMLFKILSGDIRGLINRWEIVLSSQEKINDNIRQMIDDEQITENKLKVQQSYLRLLSYLLNYKNS